MLVANRVKDFTTSWWDSKTHRPDGIVAGVDTWEHILNAHKVKSIPYPWAGLSDLVKGVDLTSLLPLLQVAAWVNLN